LILEGNNVTITPDATNDKVTIGITKDIEVTIEATAEEADITP
jgi:hypothetical protein